MEEEDEKELEKFITQQYTWDRLPGSIRKRLENSREVWKEKVRIWSSKNRYLIELGHKILDQTSAAMEEQSRKDNVSWWKSVLSTDIKSQQSSLHGESR